MHTLMVVGGAFVLLIACLLIGRAMGSTANGALAFLPLWLAGAAINMWIGVTRAGYPWSAELPIFLVVFAVPAAVALMVWWKTG